MGCTLRYKGSFIRAYRYVASDNSESPNLRIRPRGGGAEDYAVKFRKGLKYRPSAL